MEINKEKECYKLTLEIKLIFNATSSFTKLWNKESEWTEWTYDQNETKFNGVYSRDNLPNTIKDRAYLIHLDEYTGLWCTDVGIHWTALYVKNI